MEIYEIIHNSYEINTVEKLISKPTSVFFGISINDFIHYQDYDQKSNLDHIYESYNDYEIEKYKELPYKMLPLKCGVKLSIPKQSANANSVTIEGDFQPFSYQEIAFKARILADLESNREYSYVVRPQTDSVQTGSLTYRYSKCRIFVFSKYFGKFIDVSKFIVNSNISNTVSNGGNFSFSLSPVISSYDKEGNLKIPFDIDNLDNYLSIQDIYSLYDKSSSVGDGGSTSDKSLYRNNLFFSKIISTNDLVMVAFEKFKFEKDLYSNSFFIDRSYVDKFVYDLIGLVDNIQESFQAQNNECTIDISGRDMSKLLIEEGSYFFPSNIAFEALQIKDHNGNKPLRLPHTGELFFLMAQSYKSIEDILKFIFNQLLVINPLPDSFFKSGEKKSLISLIMVAIERGVSNRRVIDSSLATMSGSLVNFIQKICQYPFVEFIQDTYQNRFHFMVRVPQISPELILSNIAGTYIDEFGVNTFVKIITIDSSTVIKDSLSINDSQVYTWFQLSPVGLLPSITDEISFSFLPAIGFQEYIDQWGSKPLQLSYNYLNYNYGDKFFSPDRLSIIEEQAYKDFKFIIDSHVYLPFTRSGTIVLHNDRRLKVGNWFYFQPTNEIYMIDGVSHNYDSNPSQSTTTIQVSRGMIIDYVNGKEVKGIGFVSYFNIVNTKLNFTYKKEKRKISNVVTSLNELKTNNSKINTNFVSTASNSIIEHLKKTYEKFSPKRYKDGQTILLGGKITTQLYSIGYGHQILPSESSKYNENYIMSISEANSLYRKDIQKREYIVNSVFGPNLLQDEFDALLSITYNICFSAQGLRNKYPNFISVIKKYLTSRTQKNSIEVRNIWSNTALTTNINGKSVIQQGLKQRRKGEVGRFLSYVGFNLKDDVIAQEIQNNETFTEQIVDVLDRNMVFKDVKVNKKVFDFFIRNRQFDELN